MTTASALKQRFSPVSINPPDSIFGLLDEFKKDPRPGKINLSVGVYQDDAGSTPVMNVVRTSEKRMLDADLSKNYLPIGGSAKYNDLVGRLVLGETAERSDIHWATAQTPGGTMSLRIAGEVVRRVLDAKAIWMSNPTWANHPQIFEAAGLIVRQYGYLNSENTRLDFQRIIDSLQNAQPGEAILLHAVCHNPTGVDLSREQWIELCRLIQQKDLIPVFDFAYQGFGTDLIEDSFPIQHCVQTGGEALVCNSFSKNFGLYGERVGGITCVSQSEHGARAINSQTQAVIRTLYSNPPLHGGQIVETVLSDPTLRAHWESELTEITKRISELRSTFVKTMSRFAPNHDFQFITEQRGMFSYSGLTADQVDRLKNEHAVYALRSGRINIAGINSGNLEPLCKAIAKVMG